MANVYDVAEYILSKRGEISAVKLHKLLYYSQAWSLVWDDAPLFNEPIKAWANGPVVSSLYGYHRQQFSVSPGHFKALTSGKALTDPQRETVDRVLDFYGDKSAQWLSDLTHSEDPWRIARNGQKDGEAGNNEISLASMAEYYASISKQT